MVFKKGNKLGAKRVSPVDLDSAPLTIRLVAGHRERLRTIPGWQDKLRKLVEALILQEEGAKSPDLSEDVRETAS